MEVGDRENVISQAFARKPANVDVITRARADRKLSDGGLLFAAADGFARAIAIDAPLAPPQPRKPGVPGGSPAWRCRSARL